MKNVINIDNMRNDYENDYNEERMLRLGKS